MSSEIKGIAHCIGRFQFTLPEDLGVAGRTQSIYRVQVNTKPLPQDGIKGLVDTELARIQALPPPPGAPKSLIRAVDLQDGIKGFWYFSNSDDPDIRELEGIKAEVNHGVVATRGSLAGKEPGVEKLLTDVVASYVPAIRQGFCVGDGSVTIEPGLNESSSITFEHKKIGKFEIRFDTQTVNAPDNQTYSSVDEEKQVIEGLHGSMTVLRNHEVSAAGLKGKEIWLSAVSPNDAPFVRFTWHFPGVGGDSFHPMVNIVATAPTDQQAQMETIWDALLKSLKQVPAAAR